MKVELLSRTEIYRVTFNNVDYIIEESTDYTMENFDNNYDIKYGREDGIKMLRDEAVKLIEEWNTLEEKKGNEI